MRLRFNSRPSPRPGRRLPKWIAGFCVLALVVPGIAIAAEGFDERFDQQIQPILEDHCYACHGNGLKKGDVEPRRVRGRPARLRDGNFGGAC